MRWTLIFLCALTGTPAMSAEPMKRPNVVFLLADDMRADTIAALGNPVARTPNLDALVGRGFAMTNAYCFGGNAPAVCTPSRNMLLSGNAYFRWKDSAPAGMPNARKGLLAPGDGPNFPLTMKDAGYLTYHHGKRGNTAPLIQAKFEVNTYLKDDDAERRSGEPGQEIVDEAIRLETYEISTRKHQDCCVLFEPRSPATRTEPWHADRGEAGLDMDALVGKALAGIETRVLELPDPRG